MGDNVEPRVLEPTPVQLTRMEGVLNLILFRMDDVVTRVIVLERNDKEMEIRMTAIEAESRAHQVTARAIAEALAKDAALREQISDRKWTPVTRTIAIVVGLGALIEVLSRIWWN